VVLSRASKAFAKPRNDPSADIIKEKFNLPSVSGDINGLYDFFYTPYFLGVAAALDDPVVHEVDLMKASQIGWTYFLIAYMFARILKAATGKQLPIMMLFAKEKDGKSFHDEKLVHTGESNRWIREFIDLTASKKSGNSWWFKNFVNGFLKIVGSNSPGNVKSTSSVGLGIVEEPDDTSADIKGQGGAIDSLVERLKRYMGSMLIVGGTPTIEGISIIEGRIKVSDARVLPITCHECGDKHVLDFKYVTWVGKDTDKKNEGIKHEVYGYAKPETAVYACPECGCMWDDYQRQKNIRDTVYKAIEDGDKNCGWVATKPFSGKAGFLNLGEVYACIPGTTLAEVVQEYLEAEYESSIGDESKRIKFTNQKEGRPYAYKSDSLSEDELRARCEDYDEFIAPKGVLEVTAGVDVQLAGRLAIKIKGWGRGEESWVIYAGEIYGDVTDKKDPVWKELDKYLFTPIKHEDGYQLNIKAISIDSSDGQTSDQVYAYVRTRQKTHRGVTLMAVKGSSSDYGSKEIFSRPRSIETRGRNQTKADRSGLHVFTVGTHKAKDLISSRMKLSGDGPGRMHWYTGIRDDYFKQMTGEVKAPNRMGRFTWQQKAGVAIEFWDCEVYALHAARAIKLHIRTDVQWDALEAKLKQGDLFQEPAVSSTEKQTETKATTAAEDSLAALGQKWNQ